MVNESKQQQIPIFYSFRRCPYAMRARLALTASQQSVELREIILRDKPSEMLSLSPKSTVPVLLLPTGEVIDESVDIMLWTLGNFDPQNLLSSCFLEDAIQLIKTNDFSFKPCLDKYKYATRFPEKSEKSYREESLFFLDKLEQRLAKQDFLCGQRLTIADLAVFPFVRQFAGVDKNWFEKSAYRHVRQWLEGQTSSTTFIQVMTKFPLWKDNKENRIIFP